MRNRTVLLFFLLIITVFSLYGCKPKTNTPTFPSKPIPETISVNPNNSYYAFNQNGDTVLTIVLPEIMKNQGIPIYSSDFDEGWMKLTMAVGNKNIKLFTIYVSNDDSYKKFEQEKEYKILTEGQDYTVIWHEHKLPDNLNEEVKYIISEFKKEYNTVQNSIIINS